MGNQQSTGRTRSDTYTRYERDGEDGRYVTLDQTDSNTSHPPSFDERIGVRHDPSLPIRIRNQRQMQQQHAQQAIQAEIQNEKKTIPVVFKYPTSPRDKEAFLTGSFTNWKDMVPMVKSDNDFVAILELPEGEHDYKFNIDGRWEYDLNEPSKDDGHNGRNNIVTVKKSDFEVMEALTSDSILTNNQNSSLNKQQSIDSDIARSPPGSYEQDWPPTSQKEFAQTDKPPFLPPHLLNIILNKDTAAHYEPALLPEPNHVMLKHLYALSIRDGVMVLSTTTRYKQKFVTTCFYKPTEK
jgi:5'-AMP-activated protein kinase regulatory beta subunit